MLLKRTIDDLFYSLEEMCSHSLLIDNRHGHFLSPFHIRIDNHQANRIIDFIVNKLRPEFSWKIRPSHEIYH